MKITQIKHRPLFSVEIFPPKPGSDISSIYDTIAELATEHPDFVSVTYGAGGSTSKSTLAVAGHISNCNNLLPLPHYTAIEADYDSAEELLAEFNSRGFENILALRGDIPKDHDCCSNVFNRAADFISYLRNRSSLCIGAAAYPEGHNENRNTALEPEYLSIKAANGADFFITQLFFNNRHYFELLEKIRIKNINQPLYAGIMPVLSAKSILRIIRLCGVSVPADLSKIISRYGDNKIDMEKAGTDYAVKQINNLLDHGVDGIHLYCMNRPDIAKTICSTSKIRSKYVQNC